MSCKKSIKNKRLKCRIAIKKSWLLLCAPFFFASIGAVLARSSLGIGVAEQIINRASPFAWILLKIQAWQMLFEREIQNFLVGMHDNPRGLLWLISLSFIYGILHAAGPGHGKAVISSYLIADSASLKRGVILSFFSSILQALSAIFIVLAIFLFLPGQLTQTTRFVILISYALVMIVGLWLLIRRGRDLWKRKKVSVNNLFDTINVPALPVRAHGALMMAMPARGEILSMNTIANSAMQPKLAWRSTKDKQIMSSFRQICTECGKAHLVSANYVGQKLHLKTALSLICATGLRPCNGALFVMSFALLNQLEGVGMLAVFAMATGTFITVSLLASLAVYAKKLALILASRKKSHVGSVKIILEMCAALFIVITGTILLTSSLI